MDIFRKFYFSPHLYTYPVAVGLKSSNHEEVEEKFAEDIKLLSEGDVKLGKFYSGAEKKFMNVHAELFVTLQDQPERRGANYIMLGNGKYTSRFGYAVDFLQVYEKIAACEKCHKNVYMKEWSTSLSTNKCPKCSQWNIE